MSQTPLLEATDLVARFGGVVAVDGVSRSVPRTTLLSGDAAELATQRDLLTSSYPGAAS